MLERFGAVSAGVFSKTDLGYFSVLFHINRMKLGLTETMNRLNVEHRTSNIERPILMTLRFIYFKNKPQNTEPQPAKSSLRHART
jgi:hypothetical protein